MRRLLKTTERRRLELIEALTRKSEGFHLPQLAKQLDCSERVLKEDIVFFNDNFPNLSIEKNNSLVHIEFNSHYGMKAIYQDFLANSQNFKIIETVFFNENLSISDLAEILYLSPSSLYRLIEHINALLAEEYQFQIDTNPCRIVGLEANIRYFFYVYFNERYPIFAWPFAEIDLDAINQFVNNISREFDIVIDFSYLHVFKLIVATNITRFKHGHRIETKEIKKIGLTRVSIFSTLFTHFKEYEEVLGIIFNKLTLDQIFTPYIRDGLVLNSEMLKEICKENRTIDLAVQHLNRMISQLTTQFNLDIVNREELVLIIYTTCYLEFYEPRSGYILYDYNRTFCEMFQERFPAFYEAAYQGIKEYRRILGKPLTDRGIYYMLYHLITYWLELIYQLSQTQNPIKALILSDNHLAHSWLIKNFMEQRFKDQISFAVYNDSDLSEQKLQALDYDLFISNFELSEIKDKQIIYIDPIPSAQDLNRVRQARVKLAEKKALLNFKI